MEQAKQFRLGILEDSGSDNYKWGLLLSSERVSDEENALRLVVAKVGELFLSPYDYNPILACVEELFAQYPTLIVDKNNLKGAYTTLFISYLSEAGAFLPEKTIIIPNKFDPNLPVCVALLELIQLLENTYNEHTAGYKISLTTYLKSKVSSDFHRTKYAKKPYTLIGYWYNPQRSLPFVTSFESPQKTYPHPKALVDESWDAEIKQKTIDHLKKGVVNNSYRGFATCRICKAILGSTDLTDGEYTWPAGLEHYLEVHQVRLPEEFVTHLLGFDYNNLPTEESEGHPMDESWWCALGEKLNTPEILAEIQTETKVGKVSVEDTLYDLFGPVPSVGMNEDVPPPAITEDIYTITHLPPITIAEEPEFPTHDDLPPIDIDDEAYFSNRTTDNENDKPV